MNYSLRLLLEASADLTVRTPTTTTTTTTTTGGGANPTSTAFSGKGNIYVFPTDLTTRKGFLISGGNWYAGGGTPATYTGNPIDATAGTFNLTTSKGPCAIQAMDSSFLCGAANTVGTAFGQTDDGNLTYSGTDVFYAAASASGSTQQTVFATASAVPFNLQWAPLQSS